MDFKSISFLLGIFILINVSSSLYITLEGRTPYCFYKELYSKGNFTISYVVSGENEDQVEMTVYFNLNNIKMRDTNGYTIKQKKDTKDYFDEFEIQTEGEHEICFTNIDGSFKVLAFDFEEAEKRTSIPASESNSFIIISKVMLN